MVDSYSYQPQPTVVVGPRYVTATDQAFMDGLWTGRVEAATIVAGAAYVYHKATSSEAADSTEGFGPWGSEAEAAEAVDYAHELRETRALLDELRKEHDGEDDELIAAIERPIDGVYTGESAEDDGGDQDVRTWLTFYRDGRIQGSGHDAADGDYLIREGRWSKKRVAWIEQYDDGFAVALRGQVRPDGTIVGMWASSLGIGGSVSLSAPKK